MIQVTISAEDRIQLFKERFTHPHPHVMKKMEALYLKSCNLHNDLICEILQINGNTLRSYFKDYLEGGIEQLKVINYNRPQSDMQTFAVSIEKYFTENPPKSISEAAAKIKELTGIERKETQVRKFLKSIGFKYLKKEEVPARALTEGKKANNAGSWKKG
jgi:transposase